MTAKSTPSCPSEHDEQVNFVSWFRKNHRPVKMLAIPNGGKRNKREALRLKNEGVSKGVPDLFIPEWSLWIEMKRQRGGVLSDDQKKWREYLEGIGHTVLVCKGCDDAVKQVVGFLAAKNNA